MKNVGVQRQQVPSAAAAPTAALNKGHWTRNAVFISTILHFLFLGTAGYIVAIRLFHKPEAVFQASEAVRPRLEPRKLEMKVQVQDLQKRSARPRLQPRLASLSPSDVVLPEIKKTPRKVTRKVKRNYAVVGATGLGSGIGGGYGTGAGGGNGAVSFFGLQGVGKRIAIIVDVSLSMCEDERGGLKGYQVLKNEVRKVIGTVPIGIFFNVITFEDQVATCWNKMERSKDDSRERAVEWVMRHNSVDGPYGLLNSNYSPGAHGLQAIGGSSRLDMALTAAFEQHADTIFVITDGVPRILKERGATETKTVDVAARDVDKGDIRDWERRVEGWEKEQERRQKKGMGKQLREGGGGGRPPPRPTGRAGGQRTVNVKTSPDVYWTEDDILDHIKELQHTLYAGDGLGLSQVHVVGYSVDSDTRSFLRKVASKNRGKFRSIKGF